MNRSFVPSWRVVVLLLVSILGLSLAPQRSSAAPATAWPATRVLKYPNGPTVLLAPDPLAGSVEVGLWYAAGTRNDPPRTSGLAMAVGRTLFRSSEAIERSLQAEGSSSSEVMTPDLTARSLVLPAERVSLGLQAVAGWLKPRAIGTSDLRIALARAHEDRAARAAGSPILPAIETMLATGYSGHPYAAPVLGRESDEARITVAAVKADVASRFAPSRALITIVGRFDSAEAMRTLDQALGGSAAAAPKRVAGKAPVFPPSKGGTQQAAIGVAVPLSLVGWRGPSASDPDSPAFDLLSHLLVGGAAPYGQRALTEQDGAVAQVLGGVDRRIDASIVFLVAVSRPDSMRTAAKHVVDGVERLGREPLDRDEVDRARHSFEGMLLEPLESPAGLANALASGQLLLGDPNDWRRRIDQLDALTPDDLRRVAGRFLNAPHRYVVQTAPDTTGGAR